jgi:hypothetical protein
LIGDGIRGDDHKALEFIMIAAALTDARRLSAAQHRFVFLIKRWRHAA